MAETVIGEMLLKAAGISKFSEDLRVFTRLLTGTAILTRRDPAAESCLVLAELRVRPLLHLAATRAALTREGLQPASLVGGAPSLEPGDWLICQWAGTPLTPDQVLFRSVQRGLLTYTHSDPNWRVRVLQDDLAILAPITSVVRALDDEAGDQFAWVLHGETTAHGVLGVASLSERREWEVINVGPVRPGAADPQAYLRNSKLLLSDDPPEVGQVLTYTEG